MNHPTISVLVPIYNVEIYLARCIESVLLQDFTDYELILVDDGSPDHCPQICDEYIAKDERIKVMHKVNGGLVSARLTGWEQAKGEYVMHLDSDDYLLPGALTALYNKTKEGNYDIVKGCNKRVYDDGHEIEERPRLLDFTIEGGENYLKALIRYEISPYIWGGIYRKELFSKEIFEAVKSVSINEDLITNLAIWRGVHCYATISTLVCAYYINPLSMMQSKVISHQYLDKIGSLMLQFTKEADKDIHHIINLDRCAAHIKCFFTPELPWITEEYQKIVAFIDKGNNAQEIREMMFAKFLRFIQIRPLFWIYSRAYKVLFKRMKLKGHLRKVV